MKYQFQCPVCKMVSFYLSDNPRERLWHCHVVSEPVPYPFEVIGLTKRAADSPKAGGKSAKRKVVKAKVVRPAKSG